MNAVLKKQFLRERVPCVKHRNNPEEINQFKNGIDKSLAYL